MAEERISRAFIIGDKEHGLTIVITDPVMVLHYSKEDLKNAEYSAMHGEDLNVSLAGVAQELVQYLRTDINDMDSVERDYRTGNVPFGLAQIESLLAERNNAATIGRVIRANGSVHDVDFCLAMVIDPSDIAIRARSVGPANQIQAYVKDHKNKATVPAASQRFAIGKLNTDNLVPLQPWKRDDGTS